MARSALRLTLAYDGTGFAGSQIQPGQRTVQGELERALVALGGRSGTTVFAGRTDRGVHAAGQVVGAPDPLPKSELDRLTRALNAQLPADVAVVGLERARDGFHARYDARWREYRYRVWSGPRQPAVRGQVWARAAPLDRERMTEAAARLVGEHDFAALAGGGEGVPWSSRQGRPRGTVRRVLCCDCRALAPWWGPDNRGQLLEIRVAADGFLPRMVRNVVGLLTEVGRGARLPEEIDAVLASRDRRVGPKETAPPQGLTLWRVGYGAEQPADLPAEEKDGSAGRAGDRGAN